MYGNCISPAVNHGWKIPRRKSDVPATSKVREGCQLGDQYLDRLWAEISIVGRAMVESWTWQTYAEIVYIYMYIYIIIYLYYVKTQRNKLRVYKSDEM